MKKILFLCLCLTSALFWACEDESGEYVEQLCTDAELSSGIRSCLNVSKDTAVAHLCIHDSMIAVNNRITLPDNVIFHNIENVLVSNDHVCWLDTLENRMNRACEVMGESVFSTFKSVIDNLTFSNPSSLIDGNDAAITRYFKDCYGLSLQASLAGTFSIKMSDCRADSIWGDILVEYYLHSDTPEPVDFDLKSYVLQSFMNKIFIKMAEEEKLIRHKPEHRVTGSLQTVFGTVCAGDSE